MSLSFAARDELVQLFEAGNASVADLAKRFGLSKSGAGYLILRAGMDPWPGQSTSGGRHTFSTDEDARLLAMAKSGGVSLRAIARAMNRPFTSVHIRLMILEARAEKATSAVLAA